MIKTITTEPSSEADAAKDLESLILKEHEDIKRAGNVDILIIPSVQCFGQNPRDVDLVFLMFDKRDENKFNKIAMKPHQTSHIRDGGVVRDVREDVGSISDKFWPPCGDPLRVGIPLYKNVQGVILQGDF